MHAAVAAKNGRLKIQIARRFLVGRHAVIILLVLILVQVRGIEAGRHPGAGDVPRRAAVRRRCRHRQSRRVGNLKVAVGRAAHQAHAARVAQNARRIDERLALVRRVVNRVVAGRGIFDAEVVVVVTAVHEVIPFSLRAAVFKARPDGVIAAAIQFRQRRRSQTRRSWSGCPRRRPCGNHKRPAASR